MSQYDSDKFWGGQSYADHRELERSHKAMIDKLSPKPVAGGGGGGGGASSGGDVTGLLVLILLAAGGYVWWAWDAVLNRVVTDGPWVAAFPVGVCLILLGFGQNIRARRWQGLPRALAKMTGGVVVLVAGYLYAGFASAEAQVFWFLPVALGVIGAVVRFWEYRPTQVTPRAPNSIGPIGEQPRYQGSRMSGGAIVVLTVKWCLASVVLTYLTVLGLTLVEVIQAGQVSVIHTLLAGYAIGLCGAFFTLYRRI